MNFSPEFAVLGAILIAVTSVPSASAGAFKENVTAEISNGNVVGRRFNLDDGTMLDVFKGIPYAEPPVGDKRFRKTAPSASNWSGARLAFKYSNVCPQNLDIVKLQYPDLTAQQMSEDCLYLNIFSPSKAQDPPNTLYPVLVWIHGGGFAFGSGMEFEGGFLAQKGMVVVTFNYRLNVFGFLSTASSESPGNYGLWDQTEALRWVQNNIGAFRGNKNQVTVGGQSAGAGSVGLHLFSKYSTGLFQQAITQSGIGLAPWAIVRPPATPRTPALDLISKVGCNASSDSAMMACLRKASVDILLNPPETGTPSAAAFGPVLFTPVMDSDFFTDWPEKLLSKGDVIKVPVMGGTTKDDGSFLVGIPGIENGLTNNQTDGFFSIIADGYKAVGKSAIAMRLIRQKYRNFAKLNDLIVNRQSVFEMMTDFAFFYPQNEFSRLFSAYQRQTYLYSLEYLSIANSTSPAWLGVYHTVELYYLWGTPYWSTASCPWGCPMAIFGDVQWNAADRSMTDLFLKLWSNFIKTGNPNTPSAINVVWDQFNAETQRYLVIDSVSHSDSFQKASTASFWREVFWPIINDFTCYEQAATSRPPVITEVVRSGSSSIILNSYIAVCVVTILLSRIVL